MAATFLNSLKNGNLKMISFKQYFSEMASVSGQQPLYSSLEIEDAVKILKSKCSDSLWMFDDSKFFYRGDKKMPHQMQVSIADASKSERKSQNTSNYYTLIFDNCEGREHFPKRSKSFICTTNKNKAREYAIDEFGKGVFAIVPYNGSRIGFANQEDIWDTQITMFGKTRTLELFNACWEDNPYLSSTTWNNWVIYDTLLKSGDGDALKELKLSASHVGGKASSYLAGDFLSKLFDAYSAEETGHEAFTTSNFPKAKINLHSEVWIDGQMMFIPTFMIQEISQALNE